MNTLMLIQPTWVGDKLIYTTADKDRHHIEFPLSKPRVYAFVLKAHVEQFFEYYRLIVGKFGLV